MGHGSWSPNPVDSQPDLLPRHGPDISASIAILEPDQREHQGTAMEEA